MKWMCSEEDRNTGGIGAAQSQFVAAQGKRKGIAQRGSAQNRYGCAGGETHVQQSAAEGIVAVYGKDDRFFAQRKFIQCEAAGKGLKKHEGTSGDHFYE